MSTNLIKDLEILANELQESISPLKLHQAKFNTLLKYIMEIIIKLSQLAIVDRNQKTRQNAYTMIFRVCIMEIIEFSKVFHKLDNAAIVHLFKFGGDEQLFTKFRERLRHFAFGMDISGLEDFTNRVSDMKSDFEKIKSLLPSLTTNSMVIEEIKMHLNSQESEPTFVSPGKELKINSNAVQMEDIIGRDSFATLWRAKYSGAEVEVKVIHTISEKRKAALVNEADIIRRLSHPQIVDCYGIIEDNKQFSYVLEYFIYGTLSDYIEHSPRPILVQLNSISIDIATGLDYLHRLGIVHRDLRTNNIVIDRYLRAKVKVFGLSINSHGSIICIPAESSNPAFRVNLVD